MHTLLLVLHVLACVALIGIVLLQPDRGDGMAGVFVGMGGSVAFGVKTLDVLWKATVALAIIFMLTALGLTLIDQEKSQLQPSPVRPSPAPAPVPSPAPSPAAPAPGP